MGAAVQCGPRLKQVTCVELLVQRLVCGYSGRPEDQKRQTWCDKGSHEEWPWIKTYQNPGALVKIEIVTSMSYNVGGKWLFIPQIRPHQRTPKVPRRGSLAASDTGSSTAQAPQQLGLQLGLWGQPRPKLGPTQANFADSMRHAESLHVYRYFHRFPPLFGFDGGSCKVMLHIGHVLGPTCVQTCPSCAMLDPSWAQVGATEFGPSYAQVGPKWAPVRPNLRPRTAQVWPQSAFGCAK